MNKNTMTTANPHNLAVGDSVEVRHCYGGEVTRYLSDNALTAEVVRINRSGFPVVAITLMAHDSRGVVTVTDRHGVATPADAPASAPFDSFAIAHGVDF